jgi:hypothetical protein
MTFTANEAILGVCRAILRCLDDDHHWYRVARPFNRDGVLISVGDSVCKTCKAIASRPHTGIGE